jgi:hypothetical protein
MKYLILTADNKCIYTVTDSKIVATSLEAGDIDSFTIGIADREFNEMNKDGQFAKKVYQFVPAENYPLFSRSFKEIDSATISQEWFAQQALLYKRQELFIQLEISMEMALLKTSRTWWTDFPVVAERQLSLCNFKQGEFTPMIEEYARILEMPVDQAYKELALQIESDNLARFKISGFGEKWKRIINNTYSIEELLTVRQNMVKDFWTNSRI